MNQLETAIYSTVHDDPNLNTQDIADRMALGRQILLNKANPNTETAFFSPQQLVQLQNITNNYSINDAMNALESNSAVTAQDIQGAILSITVQLGQTAKAVEDSIKDNRFTAREKQACLLEVNGMELRCQVLKESILQAPAKLNVA